VQLHGNTIAKGPPRGSGAGPEREPPGRPQQYLSTDTLPLAISWVKGGRRITLGKLFWQGDQVCLGTPYQWRPLPDVVSLPDAAVRTLIALGVETWIVRDDLRRQAWRIPLSHLTRARMRGDERCVALKDMEPAPWPEWPFATRSINLLELAPALEEGRQLTLEGVR
jgi:hypothetical protein